MARRAFLAGSIAILAPPLPVTAQQSVRIPRVGLLGIGNASEPLTMRVAKLFDQGLRDEGYIAGRDIDIEIRWVLDVDGLRHAADELVRLNVDVICAGGTAGALAAKRATTTIPIVAGAVADPVADGLVTSLARPGANVTGNTFLAPALGPKRLQLLREVLPDARRMAALQHPNVYSERTMRTMLEEVEGAAKAGRVELRLFSATTPNQFDDAFVGMADAGVRGLLVFPSPMFYLNHRRLVALAARHRLPAIYVFREAVDAGGLMSYGANIPELFRHAASQVAKILRGARPADLPIEQASTFELLINVKTAKALRLTIPASLLARADEVID